MGSLIYLLLHCFPQEKAKNRGLNASPLCTRGRAWFTTTHLICLSTFHWQNGNSFKLHFQKSRWQFDRQDSACPITVCLWRFGHPHLSIEPLDFVLSIFVPPGKPWKLRWNCCPHMSSRRGKFRWDNGDTWWSHCQKVQQLQCGIDCGFYKVLLFNPCSRDVSVEFRRTEFSFGSSHW